MHDTNGGRHERLARTVDTVPTDPIRSKRMRGTEQTQTTQTDTENYGRAIWGGGMRKKVQTHTMTIYTETKINRKLWRNCFRMHFPSLDTSRLPAKGFALAAREHAAAPRFCRAHKAARAVPPRDSRQRIRSAEEEEWNPWMSPIPMN